MALIPLCYKMPYKDQILPITKVVRHSERCFICGCIATSNVARCFYCPRIYTCRRWNALLLDSDISTEAETENRTRGGSGYPRLSLHFGTMTGIRNTKGQLSLISRKALPKENSSMEQSATESVRNESQLRSLDSYFKKLHAAKKPYAVSSNKITEFFERGGDSSTKKELESLDSYLGKLNKDSDTESPILSSISDDQINEGNLEETPFSSDKEVELRSYIRLRLKDVESVSKGSQFSQQQDETPDLYLINILVSINFATFLFELASPIRNSDLGLFSLPSLYGAKINHLILVGEWWRLVTPMFLHSGILHVALGCWMLLTFGPQVRRGYGSFTFLLIYILGGVSGNLTSFLHTPEPSVGGTGPVFAILGAGLIYQLQNKDVISKDVSNRMFQKAMIAAALSCMLSNFGPIDDWTHLGAALTGIVYGFFTCPTTQLDDASSRAGQKEEITIVGRYADPCKSLIVFTITILVLTSFLFFTEPPLNSLELEDFA